MGESDDTTEERSGAAGWSPKDFKKAIDALCLDLGAAADHFELWKRLNEARRKEFNVAFSQSQTFWWLTFRAHLDDTMFRLCRVYDQHRNTLSLRNLVRRIQETPREALPPIDGWRSLRDEDVARDLVFVDARFNPLVKRLMIWRHKEFAHRDVEFTFDGALAKRYPIKYAEIEQLLQEGLAIANRYNSAFFSTGFSAHIHALDDYSRLLKAVDAQINERRAALDREIARARAEGAE